MSREKVAEDPNHRPPETTLPEYVIAAALVALAVLTAFPDAGGRVAAALVALATS